MVSKPMVKNNLNNQVFEEMLNNIVTGVWTKGEKIPTEPQLAKMYNVSRMPVREAVQKLRVMGLIDVIQGSGTYVRTVDATTFMNAMIPLLGFNKRNIIHMLEYRKMVETNCVVEAIHNASPKELDNIKKYNIAFESMKNPREEFKYYDYHFHNAIILASGNTIIIGINQIIRELTNEYLIDSVAILDIGKAVNFHNKIYSAIISKDEKLGFQLMQEHLQDVITQYKNKF